MPLAQPDDLAFLHPVGPGRTGATSLHDLEDARMTAALKASLVLQRRPPVDEAQLVLLLEPADERGHEPACR